MINMEPVLKRGYTFWDQALLPNDEYFERVRTVQAALHQAGLRALLVWGNAYEHADSAYLAGMATGGTLFLPAEGDPAIFTGGGGRELPFQRTLTWITDMTAAGTRAGARLRAALEERDIKDGAIALVGSHLLSAGAYGDIVENLSGYELVEFDEQLRDIRAAKRPREVTAVRVALGIAQAATAAAEQAFADGATTTQAMVAAERAARVNRARDFRALANIDSDELRPFEGLSDARRTPLLLWIGLAYGTYWADLAITSPAPAGGEAAAAVEAMAAATRAGARTGDVAQAALAVLSPASAESAVSYGLGGGIGLSLEDWPVIKPGGDDVLVDGALLSLRVLARDGERVSFENAIVQVGPSGSARLEPLSIA